MGQPDATGCARSMGWEAMEVRRKLEILADAAKYDASCASSGGPKRTSRSGRGIGSTGGSGICHAYAPDGRCISLLKILLTNFCIFDCAYCVNRNSSNVERARFTVEEIVRLTLAFYKRNYIEGLFLSSGIIKSSDYTMEELVRVARSLRLEHDFRGYIHLKTIPDAAPALIEEAGRYADRLSVNIELPRERSLARLAPQKSLVTIKATMAATRLRLDETAREPRAPRFSPAGQSTQMIIGADPADDGEILGRSAELYGAYRLKRVYYSAFSPIPDASPVLPPTAPPLLREHRLYQADWLMRFYGFAVEEILAGGAGGMLDLELDPKLAWALRHRERFPVDLNRGSREQLLRVPGLGRRTVERVLKARRHTRLALADLARLRVPIHRAAPFLGFATKTGLPLDGARLRQLIAPPRQLELLPARA
jgi:putative DNA modification/repair radical SAM protein